MIKFLINNKEIINIFSGIGTFLSSIIALYTLREIIKQRLSTYRPEILIKSFIVYINKSPLELEPEELLLYKTDNYNEYKESFEENVNKKFGVSSLYKVENLGFGPAKKIKITWSYDTQKALDILEKLLPARYYFHQYKPLRYYFLIDKTNSNYHLSITNAYITNQSIDYLTPINIKEHSHYHSIPKEIILTYYLYFILKNNLIYPLSELHSRDNDFGLLPTPQLKLEYEDMNGKKYSKEYNFIISFVSTQLEEKMEMNKEFGYLLFSFV